MNWRNDNEQLVCAGEEPPLASHLVSPRALYSHHGIYAGNGRVIHYAGLAHGLRRGPVEVVSLEDFAHGRGIRVRHDATRFDRGEVLERARSRLGERRYRVLTNNCEHFCAWALRGESHSKLADRLCLAPRTLRRAICTAAALMVGAVFSSIHCLIEGAKHECSNQPVEQ
jgi:Lecithin retinol acyltransferase